MGNQTQLMNLPVPEVKVTKRGIIFLKGFAERGGPNLPFLLRSVRRKGWYWSSWKWIDALKVGLHGLVSKRLFDILENHHIIQEKTLWQQELYDKIRRRKILQTNIFDKVFKFRLWDIQRCAASIMSVAGSFYLADSVGLGKTFSSLGAVALLREKGKIDNVIVVTQKTLKFQWLAEIKKAIRRRCRYNYLVTVVDGDQEDRLRLYDKDTFIKIVNYESLIRDHKELEPVGKRTCVIFDEAWKISNWRTKSHEVCKKLFSKASHKYILNASPVGNYFDELFGPIDILDSTVFLSWKAFSQCYINYKVFKAKGRKFVKPDGYKNVGDIIYRIAPILMRRTVRETGDDFPKITVSSYWVELSKEQKESYKKLKELKDNPLARLARARRICLFNSREKIHESPKCVELLNFLQHVALTEKVIVFSESRKFIKGIHEVLKKHSINAGTITGSESPKKREVIKVEFTDGNLRVLLMTGAGERGLNLQAADIVVNLDLPWNPERIKQRIGRVRPFLGTKDRKITVVNILALATVEEKVIIRLNEKLRDFSRLFVEDIKELSDEFKLSKLANLI